jgi:hypothetical protein
VELVKVTVTVSIVLFLSFIFILLCYGEFSISFLFGNTSTTAAHVDEPPPPPPAEVDPFKIPMKIVGCIMDNSYSGDGTVHPGDHLLFIHELCELFRCAGILPSQVKKKLFSLSLKGRAEE